MIITRIVRKDTADRFRCAFVTFCSFSLPLGKEGKATELSGQLRVTARKRVSMTRQVRASWELRAEHGAGAPLSAPCALTGIIAPERVTSAG